MLYSDDPLKDFERWDAEQNRALEELPMCEDCKYPIQDDYYFDVDGDILCQECLDKRYKQTNF